MIINIIADPPDARKKLLLQALFYQCVQLINKCDKYVTQQKNNKKKDSCVINDMKKSYYDRCFIQQKMLLYSSRQPTKV